MNEGEEERMREGKKEGCFHPRNGEMKKKVFGEKKGREGKKQSEEDRERGRRRERETSERSSSSASVFNSSLSGLFLPFSHSPSLAFSAF